MTVGDLRHGISGCAGGIPFPGRDTGDHTADDGTDAWLLVVALAVPEGGATGPPLIAVVVAALTLAVDAGV